ncbi:hypothetical protein GYMLUDRAFT_822641 [Collybiopsis luxurians FD-317 M1]|uniref:Uncharacterized protein n=1 Tax=Collybiopsis luxurians FD-317 M1 TaxID=944289 RepID=A0A0D0CM51_9AGAR|nr:hypothetical protein GYMLUDRAFT_822641 [Collybiopsis luxurians FD-317 M1]
MESSQFKPTSAGLRSLRAAAKRSDDPLKEFADLVLKIQRQYDDTFPDEIKLLIAAVYEYGVTKIDNQQKTDPRELDRLEQALSIVALGKNTSDVLYHRMYFETELLKVVRTPSAIGASGASHERAVVVYENCSWYQAERDINLTTNNDYSVTTTRFNRIYNESSSGFDNANSLSNQNVDHCTPPPPYQLQSSPSESFQRKELADEQPEEPIDGDVDFSSIPSTPAFIPSDETHPPGAVQPENSVSPSSAYLSEPNSSVSLFQKGEAIDEQPENSIVTADCSGLSSASASTLSEDTHLNDAAQSVDLARLEASVSPPSSESCQFASPQEERDFPSLSTVPASLRSKDAYLNGTVPLVDLSRLETSISQSLEKSRTEYPLNRLHLSSAGSLQIQDSVNSWYSWLQHTPNLQEALSLLMLQHLKKFLFLLASIFDICYQGVHSGTPPASSDWQEQPEFPPPLERGQPPRINPGKVTV